MNPMKLLQRITMMMMVMMLVMMMLVVMMLVVMSLIIKNTWNTLVLLDEYGSNDNY